MGREDKRLLICKFLKACHAIFAHPNILKLGRITNFFIFKCPVENIKLNRTRDCPLKTSGTYQGNI